MTGYEQKGDDRKYRGSSVWGKIAKGATIAAFGFAGGFLFHYCTPGVGGVSNGTNGTNGTVPEITSIDDFLDNSRFFDGRGELDATIMYHEGDKVVSRDLYGLGAQDVKRIFKFFDEQAIFYDDGSSDIESRIKEYRDVIMPISGDNLRTLNPTYGSEENSGNLEKNLSTRRVTVLDEDGRAMAEAKDYRLDAQGLSEGMRIFADDRENINDISERFPEWQINDRYAGVERAYNTMVAKQEEGYRTVLSFPTDGRGKAVQVRGDTFVSPSFTATRIGQPDESRFIEYEPEAPEAPSHEPSRESRLPLERRPYDSPERSTPSRPEFSDDAQGPTDRPHGDRDLDRDGMGGEPSRGPRDITRDRGTRSTPSSRDQGNDRRDAVDRPVRSR